MIARERSSASIRSTRSTRSSASGELGSGERNGGGSAEEAVLDLDARLLQLVRA